MAGRPGLRTYLRALRNLVYTTVPVAEFFFQVLAAVCPPYRRRVEQQRAEDEATEAAERLTRRYDQLFQGLDPKAQAQFQGLSRRCGIFCDPTRLHGEETSTAARVLRAQLDGVNRLLWVHLKLLHTRSMLERFLFLQSSNESAIAESEAEARRRLAELPADVDDEIVFKKRHSLEGILATITVRCGNLKRARENFACVELEIERIAATLTTLADLAVNCHDAGLITREVDAFVQSVEATEQTISDLQMFTGFTAQDIIAPPILPAPQPEAGAAKTAVNRDSSRLLGATTAER